MTQTITLTQDNAIDMIRTLIDLIKTHQTIQVRIKPYSTNKKTQYEQAMEDLHAGKNILTLDELKKKYR